MQDIEQFKKLIGGYIPSKLNGTEYVYNSVVRSTNNTEELPVSFRLWTSGVKNQVEVGSCVAHSLATLKETQDYYDTKSIEKYSTSWIYLIRDLNQYKGEGMMIKEALNNLRNIGVVPYSMLPGNVEYSDGHLIGYKAENDSKLVEEAKKHRIKSYVMPRTKDEIKKSLYYDKSPVVIGIIVYESFLNTTANGIVPIPKITKEQIYGGHAMVIMGWINIDNEEYWVVQNSWGETWGDNGYCYLKIKDFPIDEMWASIDIEDYPCNLIDIENHWSKEYIEKCVRAGLINGFEDNTFRADESVTRGQLCTVIWKVLDKLTR